MNSTFQPTCCPLGSKCDDSPCSISYYYGQTTSTETVTSSSTSVVSTVTNAACFGRRCNGANYECPSSLGGGCCAYGSNCRSSIGATAAVCVGAESTTSTSASALLSPIPSGCSLQGQTYCTAAGGGCCDAGYSCSYITSQFFCVSATATESLVVPTGSGISLAHENSNGLSTGAKAGIAVGVILGVLLIVGALVWICLRRRRRSARSTVTAQEMQSNPPVVSGAVGGPVSDDGGIRPYDAQSGPRHMSEVDGFSYGYAASSTHGARSTSDYFVSGAGVYDHYQQQHQPAGSSPPPGNSAVEIGGRGDSVRRPARHTRMSSHTSDGDGSQSELADTEVDRPAPARRVSARSGGAGMRDSIAEVFELPGSHVVMPPVSPGGESEREVFHDAPEMRGGASGLLPQPLPTPGSERSEYATPSPMSKEERAQQESRRHY